MCIYSGLKYNICGGNWYSSFCAKFSATRQRKTDSFKPIFRAEGTSKRTFPLKTSHTSFKHFEPSEGAHKLKHYWFSKYFMAPKDNIGACLFQPIFGVLKNECVPWNSTWILSRSKYVFWRTKERKQREKEGCKNVWYKIRLGWN